MSKDKDSKDILLVALIGGIVGVCAASAYFASKGGERESKSSSLSSLGRVVVQIGEMLNADDVKHTPIFKDVEKKAQKYESTVSHVLEFISIGMQLWEKIRK